MTNLDDVLKQVREELRPLPETVAKTENVAQRLVARLEAVFGAGKVSLEGSLAKRTMLRGREEADIFIHFRSDVPVDQACNLVVQEGVQAIKDENGAYRLRYANHPYVEGFVQGIRVNIVPCYDAEYGGWVTPVDRTPHHTRYVNQHLSDDQRDEVRLLKAFLINDGLYGGEIRFRGFSGYLCELLIIHFSSFKQLLQQVLKWKPPVDLSLNGVHDQSPLIFPDPVDPKRNAAAAVSLTSLSNFIMKTKLFLKKPSRSYFFDKTSLKSLVEGRNFLIVLFDVPDQPPDVLWGELNKSMQGFAKSLEVFGFKVIRSDRWVDSRRGVFAFELETLSLPRVFVNRGPPIWSGNAVDFIDEQLKKPELLAYPWVMKDRLYSLLARKHVDATETFKMLIDMDKASVSKKLKPHLKRAKIYSDIKVAEADLLEEEKLFLEDFVRACPHYVGHYVSLS
ncbi:MAG: CCA tRNA nucleotidyltransferase [Candidatus Caldarchaeum sp.]